MAALSTMGRALVSMIETSMVEYDVLISLVSVELGVFGSSIPLYHGGPFNHTGRHDAV